MKYTDLKMIEPIFATMRHLERNGVKCRVSSGHRKYEDVFGITIEGEKSNDKFSTWVGMTISDGDDITQDDVDECLSDLGEAIGKLNTILEKSHGTEPVKFPEYYCDPE